MYTIPDKKYLWGISRHQDIKGRKSAIMCTKNWSFQAFRLVTQGNCCFSSSPLLPDLIQSGVVNEQILKKSLSSEGLVLGSKRCKESDRNSEVLEVGEYRWLLPTYSPPHLWEISSVQAICGPQPHWPFRPEEGDIWGFPSSQGGWELIWDQHSEHWEDRYWSSLGEPPTHTSPPSAARSYAIKHIWLLVPDFQVTGRFISKQLDCFFDVC